MNRIFLVLTSCLLAAGCQVAQMRVDPELSLVMPLQVTGSRFGTLSRHIDFGKWSVEQKRSAFSRSFSHIIPISAEYNYVPYEFTLSEDGLLVARGDCLARGLAFSLGSITVEPPNIVPPLTCGLNGQGLVTLTLKDKVEFARDREVATVSFDSGTWEIDSIHEIVQVRGPSTTPAGYRIMARDRLIAEVETINRGRVWISPDLSAQDEVRAAAVAAVLLLYEKQESDD
jgi:hypothetical protein